VNPPDAGDEATEGGAAGIAIVAAGTLSIGALATGASPMGAAGEVLNMRVNSPGPETRDGAGGSSSGWDANPPIEGNVPLDAGGGVRLACVPIPTGGAASGGAFGMGARIVCVIEGAGGGGENTPVDCAGTF
jgi:hypothetical protein